MRRSPITAAALVRGFTAAATLLAEFGDLEGLLGGASTIKQAKRREVIEANTEAARLMLQAGLPVDGVSQHRATPLHWAAWQGNAELVRLVLERRPDLENRSNDYSGSPLDWALHGSENGWDRARGNYPETVSLLLAAGAQRPAKISGSAAVQAVLRQHGAA